MRKLRLALSLCSSLVLFAANTTHPRLSDATKVFKEVMATPDKGIPRDLVEKAHCIIIVPIPPAGGTAQKCTIAVPPGTMGRAAGGMGF